MISLTKADSQEEQSLAKALGLDIGPWKKTRKSRSKCTSGEPYILVTNVSCRLCNSMHTKIFKMSKQGSFLHSEEIGRVPPEEELYGMKVKCSSYTVRHCCNCYSYLANLTKESLVQRFLSYISNHRNFLV
jgi:hypothetical protein